jgi:hypothetical protein
VRTRVKHVDPDLYLEYWTDRVRRLLEAYVRDAALVPDAQRVDVDFDAFVADDMAALGTIHERAGLPLDGPAAAAIARYRADHGRHKHGSIDHDLRRDFGVDPEALRAAFAFYTDHLAALR